MEVPSVKRYLALLAVATVIMAIAFVIAIAQSATGTRLPTLDLPLVMLGTIAVAVSIPVVGVLIVLVIHRRIRQAWAKAHPLESRMFAAYLTFQVVVAVIAWISFLLVLQRC